MISSENYGICIPYVVRTVPNKGLGLFAGAAIPRGTAGWVHVTGQYAVHDEKMATQTVSVLIGARSNGFASPLLCALCICQSRKVVMKNDLKGFISSIENKQKREDTITLVKLMEEEAGYKGYLTGNIIGFGKYQYKYESGREGESIVVGFSPRKQNIAIYIMPGFSKYEDILEALGKHKIGKSCLYINKLADIEIEQLRKIVNRSVKIMQKRYKCKNA